MSSPTTPLDPSRMTTADAGVLPAIGLVSITERPGTVIGRYTLIESIGAGGFGAVFLAEQTEPVARRVALKVLKLGMDTVQVIARFEQERQALALMDHPHIAKVLDAGATDAGRPYFVMELVTGEPITTFCDSKGLSVRQRLELFVQVCNAIQHAHQKGIIHRDIKPSNILVSMHDGKPHARVIDFGIAKATEQPLTGETMHTRLGQWVGTPLYMSPEQSDGSVDVDTRSDVYSLGVLLYELLTGTTPFEAPASDSTMSELQRLIRDVDPPRPSTRVSTSSGTLPQLAASRSTEPRRLLSLLRGELDWVAMKAIEKEPERRYQTANGLANDLLRYLAGEPVVAAPPSTTYRLRKLVARNKGAVIAAAIVALALIGGLAGTLWQARAAAVERDAARTEAARATALNEFMREMLTASNPEAQGSRDVTVVEVLARASESAGKTLADQPEAEAEARLLLGETFRSLGRNQEAIAELERAVALREGGAAGDPVAHSRTLRGLALAHREQSEFDEALALYQRASAAMVGSDDEAQIDERITTEYEQALVLSRMARYAEAEQHLDASQALVDRLSGNTSVKRAQIITARAIIAENWKGDLEQAERLSTEALELQRTGTEQYLISDALNNLALIKGSRGKYDEAISLYEESLAINKNVYGERHPVVAVNLENMGSAYMRKGDFAKTLALLDEVLSIRESVLGKDSLAAARTRFNMGVVANQSGDFARAFELLDQGLAIFRAEYGENSYEAGVAFYYRGVTSEALGRYDAALRDYESSLAILETLGAPAESSRLNTLQSLARLQCTHGSIERGRARIEQTLSVLDPADADQKKWIDRFESLRGGCGVER